MTPASEIAPEVRKARRVAPSPQLRSLRPRDHEVRPSMRPTPFVVPVISAMRFGCAEIADVSYTQNCWSELAAPQLAMALAPMFSANGRPER